MQHLLTSCYNLNLNPLIVTVYDCFPHISKLACNRTRNLKGSENIKNNCPPNSKKLLPNRKLGEYMYIAIQNLNYSYHKKIAQYCIIRKPTCLWVWILNVICVCFINISTRYFRLIIISPYCPSVAWGHDTVLQTTCHECNEVTMTNHSFIN